VLWLLQFWVGKLTPIVLAYYTVISLITYALYASDKAAAKKVTGALRKVPYMHSHLLEGGRWH